MTLCGRSAASGDAALAALKGAGPVPHGVRVNAVNPSLTVTERLKEGLAADARQRGISEEEALRQAASAMPQGRLASADEVAGVVVYLSSSRASYVSGAILNVDGASAATVV